MRASSTSRDIQRVTFVESLHNSLRKNDVKKALADNTRFLKLAHSYLEDGLDESESIELLMIDGLSRDAAESCVSMASSQIEDAEQLQEEEGYEYSFQFEDSYGKIWSSYDINRTVRAYSEQEAWVKAENLLIDDDEGTFDPPRVISVSRS